MSLDITPIIPEGRQLIEGYGEGGFRIGGVKYAGAVLVFPEKTLPWPMGEADGASLASLAPVIQSDPPTELLLLGADVRRQGISAELGQALSRACIVVEAMDPGAACRTFNVLLAEGRRVAAALIPLA
jgi:uncharacterized protein